MAGPLIVEDGDRFVLRRRRRPADAWLMGLGLVYAAFVPMFAWARIWEGLITSAAMGLPLLGTAIWRRARRDEIRLRGHAIEVRRLVGPLTISREIVEAPQLALKDHASQPDAMFGVTAMTGPGHLELRRDDRPVAAIAHGLAYETEELAELQRRLSAAMAKQGW